MSDRDESSQEEIDYLNERVKELERECGNLRTGAGLLHAEAEAAEAENAAWHRQSKDWEARVDREFKARDAAESRAQALTERVAELEGALRRGVALMPHEDYVSDTESPLGNARAYFVEAMKTLRAALSAKPTSPDPVAAERGPRVVRCHGCGGILSLPLVCDDCAAIRSRGRTDGGAT